MFIGRYNKSLIITYVGVIFAITGMYFAFLAKFKISIICLIASGICDLFDGKFARMCKRTKEDEMFGIQLDSLADTIDFVAFPIVLGLCLGFNEWYQIVGYAFLAMAGVQRLSHFNVLVMNKKDSGPVKSYSGLPVTSTSISYPIFWLISNWVSYSTYSIIYTVLTFLTAFLFIANIKIPKFKGIAYPILVVVAIAGIVALILV